MSGTHVFVDFDGTITDLDTFDVLVRHFAGPHAWADTEIGLDDGTVSLRDVLQKQAAHVRAPFDEVAALLRREVAVDATFAPFVAQCRARGVAVTALSSGIAPIIAGRLAEIGCADVPVVANDVDADAGGWSIRFRDGVPNGTDKAAVVRAASEAGLRTVFVGDGRSDYEAALVADRRFAKAGRQLQHYLRARGAAYDVFTTFADVQAALFEAAVPAAGRP
ncbi:MAG: MtnX-like HAD-IB family phosphatase [Vulcanimicrobiaceae bacterium]